MTKQDTLDSGRLLDKRQAAAKLKLSERAVNYRMKDGSLAYIKFGPRAVRFLPEDLERYILAHRIGGAK